jgi:vancomycin resistance protein YoaR
LKIKARYIYNLMAIPALTAGIFMYCGYFFKLPEGVVIDDVNVGGMTKAEACNTVRAEIEKNMQCSPLVIYGIEKNYTLSYPDITYVDNLDSLLKRVKRGGKYCAEVTYSLPRFYEIATDICLNECKKAVDSKAIFNAEGKPFTYTLGASGREVDIEKLERGVNYSLKHNLSPVKIEYTEVPPHISLDEVKQNTTLLYEFTTSFDGGNENRVHNIRLAGEKLNGKILGSGEILSFNQVVGERTVEQGFKLAKIIEKGEYVQGIGGGVCQVSTTLYNCALLSGLEIVEYHPHTLAVSYVPPSRDAMVSGKWCDLKIKNPYKTPIYIRANCKSDSITFSIYGFFDGTKNTLITHITGDIPKAEVYTEDEALVRDGKDGIVSEGYLVTEKGGVVIKKLIRRDKYLPINKVIFSPPTQLSTPQS